jgi:outer membrane lipoprotein carrier protein
VRPLLFLLAAIVFVSPSKVDPAHQFEKRYSSAKTLQATFLERYIENDRLVRAEAGIAYFRKPGRMRWEYESPEKNLFLVDGKSAWFYVPADHTVTRVPAKESSDWRTPLALLAGEAKLSRVCSQLKASSEPPETPGNALILCTVRGSEPSTPAKPNNPSASDASQSALLEIEPATGILSRVFIRQPAGTSIEFKFAKWQFNPALPEVLFHFSAPQGTAIVNGELPARESSANP